MFKLAPTMILNKIWSPPPDFLTLYKCYKKLLSKKYNVGIFHRRRCTSNTYDQFYIVM